MAQIILDFGSGNTCRNDKKIVKHMLDELKKIDTGKHEIIIKWQLFEKAGDNVPLHPDVFVYAYEYAKKIGYTTTSSIFDKHSLDFLLLFDIPFVKLANNRNLDWLIGEIPRKIPVYVSYGDVESIKVMPYRDNVFKLLCVSDYPAKKEDYERFDLGYYLKSGYGISDHTLDFELFNKYNPEFIEWHYGLQDSIGLDAGLFMRTPEMLKEVL